jgi:hypothetical protein
MLGQLYRHFDFRRLTTMSLCSVLAVLTAVVKKSTMGMGSWNNLSKSY